VHIVALHWLVFVCWIVCEDGGGDDDDDDDEDTTNMCIYIVGNPKIVREGGTLRWLVKGRV